MSFRVGAAFRRSILLIGVTILLAPIASYATATLRPQFCEDELLPIDGLATPRDFASQKVIDALKASLETKFDQEVRIVWQTIIYKQRDANYLTRSENLVAEDGDGAAISFLNYQLYGDRIVMGFSSTSDKAGRGGSINYRERGAYGDMIRAVADLHPQVTRIETQLTAMNKAIVQIAMADGLNCHDAIKLSPAYRVRARAGFAKILRADCEGKQFELIVGRG